MGIQLLPSNYQPVTTDELAQHLRLGEAEAEAEESLLDQYIQTATQFIESQTRASIITRQIRLSLDCFPHGPIIDLPRPPLHAVTSVRYMDLNDQLQTVPADHYRVDISSQPGRIILKPGHAWPRTDQVFIEYTAGHENPPAILKQAVLMLAGHYYAHREATSDRRINDVPMAVQSIIHMHAWPEAA